MAAEMKTQGFHLRRVFAFSITQLTSLVESVIIVIEKALYLFVRESRYGKIISKIH